MEELKERLEGHLHRGVVVFHNSVRAEREKGKENVLPLLCV